jgi:hypothetical protein
MAQYKHPKIIDGDIFEMYQMFRIDDQMRNEFERFNLEHRGRIGGLHTFKTEVVFVSSENNNKEYKRSSDAKLV